MAVIAKRGRSLVRLVLYMLRKGIPKGKLIMGDVNVMIKRGINAGKTLQKMFYHHHHAFNLRRSLDKHNFPSPQPGDYEYFSCSNSPGPAYPHTLFSLHKIHSTNYLFSCPHAPQLKTEEHETATVNAAAVASLEFGKSPVLVRQLRITDSPFPLHGVDEDNHVDEAAEEFINNFYKNLRWQN